MCDVECFKNHEKNHSLNCIYCVTVFSACTDKIGVNKPLLSSPLLCVQYHLSKDTIEALRLPTFDAWQWEPNEVSLLLT